MLSNILNIEGTSILSKTQQKTINGGNMDEGGTGGTCNAMVLSAPGFTPTFHYNIDKATAKSAVAASQWGGHWCCDSCDEATWL
tara:strand:- start:50594 stop:50845 length:252 start_codon:yes stop_codon:yes gene_type:complete